MYGLLSVLAICIALLFAINSLQNKPITFIIHKKFENVEQPAKPLTEEEKKFIEEQKQTMDGMNEVIRITQEFLGGDVEDADAKR